MILILRIATLFRTCKTRNMLNKIEAPVLNKKINMYHAVLILLQRVSSGDKKSSLGLAAVYLADLLLMDPSGKLTFGSPET